jgi:hypothetical protein
MRERRHLSAARTNALPGASVGYEAIVGVTDVAVPHVRKCRDHATPRSTVKHPGTLIGRFPDGHRLERPSGYGTYERMQLGSYGVGRVLLHCDDTQHLPRVGYALQFEQADVFEAEP